MVRQMRVVIRVDQKKPTKYYSSRQERMIADYLGWSVVSGSGARAFNPGDIISNSFLGECKTFTEKSDTIYCYNRVWDKICKEAKSVMKCPVLFIDNGTQDPNHTWCVIPKTFMESVHNSTIVEGTSSLRVSKTRVSFSDSVMQSEFKMYQKSVVGDAISVSFMLSGDIVVLIPLHTLKIVTE